MAHVSCAGLPWETARIAGNALQTRPAAENFKPRRCHERPGDRAHTAQRNLPQSRRRAAGSAGNRKPQLCPTQTAACPIHLQRRDVRGWGERAHTMEALAGPTQRFKGTAPGPQPTASKPVCFRKVGKEKAAAPRTEQPRWQTGTRRQALSSPTAQSHRCPTPHTTHHHRGQRSPMLCQPWETMYASHTHTDTTPHEAGPSTAFGSRSASAPAHARSRRKAVLIISDDVRHGPPGGAQDQGLVTLSPTMPQGALRCCRRRGGGATRCGVCALCVPGPAKGPRKGGPGGKYAGVDKALITAVWTEGECLVVMAVIIAVGAVLFCASQGLSWRLSGRGRARRTSCCTVCAAGARSIHLCVCSF